MNNEMYTLATISNLADLSLDSHFPKLIVKSVDDFTDMVLVTRPEDYDPVFPPLWVTVDTLVIQPDSTHLDSYVMGENYETLALTLPSGQNLVISKPIPTPVLQKEGPTSFSWSSVPGDVSQVFRAVIPVGEIPTQDSFSIVAVITSDSSKSYFEDKFARNLDDFYYLYYVISPHGTTPNISLP